jgi:hypothetical protein
VARRVKNDFLNISRATFRGPRAKKNPAEAGSFREALARVRESAAERSRNDLRREGYCRKFEIDFECKRECRRL